MPYERPEHPPAETKTRSPAMGLPCFSRYPFSSEAAFTVMSTTGLIILIASDDISYESLRLKTPIKGDLEVAERSSELAQGGNDLLVRRLVRGGVRHPFVPEDALTVEDETRALRDAFVPERDPGFVEHTVHPRDLPVEVAQERELQVVGLRKDLQREEAVHADAHRLRVERVELGRTIPEGAQLFIADTGKGEREEEQDGLSILRELRKLPLLLVGVRKRKVRHPLTYPKHHLTCHRPSADL